MHRKMSGRRRAAFLRALEACGNQTLAAERACVSRSWVCKGRAEDPQFDATVRAAVEKARQSFDRLRTSGEGGRRPPSGWGHLDGVELVVKGTNGRRVQIARARAGQISSAVEDRFLATLGATCNVKAAYTAAGVSKGAIYTHRRRWPAFARRWDDAIKLGSLILQFAMVHHAGNPFPSTEVPEPEEIEILPVPMRPRQPPRRNYPTIKLTPDQAMHSLYMHQYETDRIGRRPGLQAKPPPMEEVHRVILRNIEAIKGAREVPEEAMARAREEWALRRPSTGSG